MNFKQWISITCGCIVLAACAEQPCDVEKQSVSVGLQLEPPVLDPTINPAAAIAQITLINIFEGLTRINEFGEVLPSLAERWEVSPDGKIYTFYLHEGVQFSDGSSLESSDIRFTFERNAAAESKNPRQSYFTQIEEIKTPDDFTVIIILKEPNSLFLFNLAENMSVIVAPETADNNSTSPIGTGPFKFSNWIPGESVHLEKNPLYRDADTVSLETIVFKFINDAASQVTALKACEIDYLPNIAAIEQADSISEDKRFRILNGTTEGETILAINNSRPPFNQLLVRRALSHAINREEIIDGAMFGFGVPIGSHFAPHHPSYLDLTGRYPHDKALAEQLLSEAGLNEFSLTITLPPTTYARRSGEIIQSQLEAVGIEVNLEPVEWARWLDSVYSEANYDLTIVSHVEPLDIGIYANSNYYFRYDSSDFNNLIQSAMHTPEPAKQHEFWQLAQQHLAEDAVNVFLFELPRVGAARKELIGLWNNAPIFLNDMAVVRWE